MQKVTQKELLEECLGSGRDNAGDTPRSETGENDSIRYEIYILDSALDCVSWPRRELESRFNGRTITDHTRDAVERKLLRMRSKMIKLGRTYL